MLKATCKNKWCKASFEFDETKSEETPQECFVCKTDSDQNGVPEWEDFTYNDPYDQGHQDISFNTSYAYKTNNKI